MKKFLVYLCVILVAVSTGFAIFYLVRDNEVISLSGSTAVYKDVGTKFDLGLNVSKPNSYTKITLTSSNEDVLEITDKQIDVNDEVVKGSFYAKVGGVSRVNFQTSNSKFRNLYYDVVIGDGTVNYPFRITTAEQLASIGKTTYDASGAVVNNPYTLSSSYELANDIDLSALDKVWEPIGFESNTPFSGTFNGNGYSIQNLNVENANGKNIGLFQEIAVGASVKNVKFVNAVVKTTTYTEYAGVVAGVNAGIIQGVEIKSSQFYNDNATVILGGVVGFNKSINTPTTKSIARVDRCSANVLFNGQPAVYDQQNNLVTDATLVKGNVGGLVGYNLGGIIINSYTLGTYQTSTDATFGGIVNINEYLPITSGSGVYSTDEGAHVKDCYSIVNIEKTGSKLYQAATIIFENIDYATDPINKIMGNYYDLTLSNGYTGIYASADAQYVVEGKQTVELKTINLPSHETFTYSVQAGVVVKTPSGIAYWNPQAWFIDGTNEGYPVIKYDASNVADNFPGTGQDVVAPADPVALQQSLLGGLDKNHVISQDIDLTGTEWQPVGTISTPFVGSLTVAINPATNKPFVIKGLTIISNSYDYAGMFGVINGATITNLVLENPVIVNDNHGYVGAIAGANGIDGVHAGGTIAGAEVIGGTLRGKIAVGGIVGTSNGTLTECHVYSDATNAVNITVAPDKTGYAGGLAGENHGSITSKTANYYNNIIGKVKISAQSTNKIQFMGGGVAGLNKGSIEYVNVSINTDDGTNVFGVIADSTYVTYAGGVAGYGDGSVNYALVSARVMASTSNDSYVAGVTAYIDAPIDKKINVNNAYVYSSYLKAKYTGGLVGYLAGSDSVSVKYKEQDFFKSIYQEKYVINSKFYDPNTLMANISASAVADSTSLYGTYSGGLVCQLQRGFVTDCYSQALLCATNNAGFVFEINYNASGNVATGGVITRCYVVANFSGGKSNFNVSSSNIHGNTSIKKRTAGFIDDYYFATGKGKGKNPSYFAGAVSSVVNWFKSDANHDVTRERELKTLRSAKFWKSWETKNKVTDKAPWIVKDGALPTLDINEIYYQVVQPVMP